MVTEVGFGSQTAAIFFGVALAIAAVLLLVNFIQRKKEEE